MKDKTKEDIKQICTFFSEDMGGIGTCGYSLTEEQFNKLFEYIEKNFVEKPKTKELKADWEDIARQFHDIYEKNAYLFGYGAKLETGQFDPESADGKLITLTVREVLKNFVAKGELQKQLTKAYNEGREEYIA